MARRRIFRDYRSGSSKGQFVSKADADRSRSQGGDDIRGEYMDAPDSETITNVDDLFDLYEDTSFDPEDFVEYEYHGTGDTGRASE